MNYEVFNTERLILRKLIPADFRDLFENYPINETREFLNISTDEDFERQKEKYKAYAGSDRTFVFFQMMDKNDQKIIGECGFHNWSLKHRRAELGYSFTNEDYKGKGLMTEAIRYIIEHVFATSDLNRIEACIAPGNAPSLKLIRKFNFTEEGRLRQHYFKDGKLEDSLIFSLLKEDFLLKP